MKKRPGMRRAQQGWSLVEALVVMVLMGGMSLGLWKTMETVDGGSQVEHARDDLERAEDALYGMLLRDNQLPMPESPIVDPLRPNHMEGWLPRGVLGSKLEIRYMVDRTMLSPPVLRYQADPMGLLDDEVRLPVRTNVNGLDVCLALVRQERNGIAVNDGLHVAFAVQGGDVLGRTGDRSSYRFSIGSEREGVGSKGLRRTRTSGYTELLHRLGCIATFSRIATEVRATTLASDLHEMAKLNATFRHLGWRATEEAIANHAWRAVNASVRLANATWGLAATLLTIRTTLAGALAAATIPGFILDIATWNVLIKFSKDRWQANRDALPGAIEAYRVAQAYAESLKKQRDAHRVNIDTLLNLGVMP